MVYVNPAHYFAMGYLGVWSPCPCEFSLHSLILRVETSSTGREFLISEYFRPGQTPTECMLGQMTGKVDVADD